MVVKIFQMVDGTATIKEGRPRAARILRIIARVIGIIVAVFFLVMLIGNIESAITSQGFDGITAEWLFIIIPLIIAVGAFIYAWWNEFLGGILLLVGYLLLSFSPSVHSLFYKEEPQFYIGMFYFAAPFLVAGVLFIIASLLDRGKPT
ncbi:MAG: hypothetical protein JXA17_04670 [Dehalococcoidales bacterium]|nr:hypothetical protein [Dehalococcoidales bacterium]